MNLLIYMKDREYGEKLNSVLNNRYKDVYSRLIDKEEDISDDCLVLTDFDNDIKEAKLLFSSKKERGVYIYQSLDKIYEFISQAYSNREELSKKIKLISCFNVDEINSSNPLAKEFAEKLNTKSKTLLLNFNFGHKYKLNSGIEKGVEDLIFLSEIEEGDKISFKGNEYLKFDYLNSCYYPLESESDLPEKIDNLICLLKKMSYKYVVIDGTLFLSKGNLKLIEKSDLVVLYGSLESNYFGFVKNFLKKKGLIDKKSILINTNSKIFKKVDDNYYKLSKLEEVRSIDFI